MKKNIWAKIFATIALFGIAIWIVWTGILFMFQANTPSPQQIQLTEEEIQELIEAQWLNATWSTDDGSLSEVFDSIETSQDINLEETIAWEEEVQDPEVSEDIE